MRRSKPKCPHCGEDLDRSVLHSAQAKLNIPELSRDVAAFMIQCPDCRRTYYLVDGKVMAKWDIPDHPDDRPLVVDMTAYENQSNAAHLLNQEGNALMSRGRVDMAKAKYEQAIQITRHDPDIWFNLGRARYDSDDLAGAEDAYRNAVKYGPSVARAWSNLGFVLLQTGKTAEALRSFEQGINADPNYPKCYVGKGQILAAVGRVNEGRRCLEKALKLDPGSAAAKQALQMLSARS